MFFCVYCVYCLCEEEEEGIYVEKREERGIKCGRPIKQGVLWSIESPVVREAMTSRPLLFEGLKDTCLSEDTGQDPVITSWVCHGVRSYTEMAIMARQMATVRIHRVHRHRQNRQTDLTRRQRTMFLHDREELDNDL